MQNVSLSAAALVASVLLPLAPSVSRAQNAPELSGNFHFGPNLIVVCPGAESAHPMFRDVDTGRSFRIIDPRQRALAAKSCGSAPPEYGAANGNVNIVNQRPAPLYVSFTLQSHAPGPIAWGANCTASGVGAVVAPGQTCVATVPSSVGVTRFCAALDAAPADCFDAQVNHQTMVETNFQSGSAPGCFNKGNCVWYDISVIPSSCTDALWKQNQCAGTGGASYNLPVALACSDVTTFVCQGPADGTFGTENYPKNCGNPDATCVSSQATCVNAYFFPMFYPPENKYGPNVPCLAGKTLGIIFMAGS
jgi:hypothetical protein